MRKSQRNILYLPTEVRSEVEKIAIEISFKRGKRFSESSFVQYLIKNFKSQAIKELTDGSVLDD